MPETGSGDHKKRGWFASWFINLGKKGVLKAAEDITGENLHDTPEGTGNPLGAIIGKKIKQVEEDVAQGLTDDEEIQNAVTEGVRVSMREGVQDIRGNFGTAISQVNESLKNVSDKRDTYAKMKDLLGFKDTDSFFTKLIKKTSARLLCIGVPILSFISAKVSARFAGTPDSENDFRQKFTQIYDSALGRMTAPPGAPAPSAA